jgi:hypothetical protein
MGLDMYLYRTKLVHGWTPEDYARADDVVGGEVLEKVGEPSVTIVNASTGKVAKYDPPVGSLEKARLLAPLEIRDAVTVRGESFKYFSIFEEIGYWRKENHIHRWFVERVQGGVDECQHVDVKRTDLEALAATCRLVLKTPARAEKLLPTQGGFFFGPTDYDPSYFDGVRETVRIIEEVLKTTDWKKQVVLYHSSW